MVVPVVGLYRASEIDNNSYTAVICVSHMSPTIALQVPVLHQQQSLGFSVGRCRAPPTLAIRACLHRLPQLFFAIIGHSQEPATGVRRGRRRTLVNMFVMVFMRS